MSLDANNDLIPIPLSGYTRLFNTVVGGPILPHPRNALERLHSGTYDYVMFCKDVHTLNRSTPIDRRQMETHWALSCRNWFKIWEMHEGRRYVGGKAAKPGAIDLWREAFLTYSKALKWVDSYRADNYWKKKVREKGYEQLDIERIPLADEFEESPKPDFWHSDGTAWVRTKDGNIINHTLAVECWLRDFMEADILMDEAQENFYSKLRRDAEEALGGVTRQMGKMALEAETASPPRKKSKSDEIMGDAMEIDEEN